MQSRRRPTRLQRRHCRPRILTLPRIRSSRRPKQIETVTVNADIALKEAREPTSSWAFKKLHPPSLKKSWGSSLTVFMIAAQLRLTGPSENGMSTELKTREVSRRHENERSCSIHSLEPFLDAVELIHRNRVDVNRRTSKVLEDKDEIKVLQAVLNALEVSNFDLVERHDEEGRFGEEDERVRRRLQENVGAERYTLETEFSEGDVDFDATIRLRGIGSQLVI